MAREPKLKVFRTPTGFHDAYVAAPSQKAALEAWGSDKNLFSAGAADRVEDPELMREPLANPGKVIRRVRGTMAEHMAALPKDSPRGRAKAARKDTTAAKAKAKPAPPPKPKPRPSREPLDRIEDELAKVEHRHRDELAALALRQAELDRDRREIEAAQEREQHKIGRRIEGARDKYDRAMSAWRAG